LWLLLRFLDVGRIENMNDLTDTVVEDAFTVGIPRPGFEHLDVDEAELRPGASVRYIYCSGIEAWSRDEFRRALTAIMKVLQPAGVVRVATPDLDSIVYGYLLDWNQKQLPGTTRAQRLNDWRKSVTAQFIFNEEDLRTELEHAGFVDVWRLAAGASSVEVFLDCEEDATELVLEARKPASMND
jgi:predicted SAM-dependent methyltransferase